MAPTSQETAIFMLTTTRTEISTDISKMIGNGKECDCNLGFSDTNYLQAAESFLRN
jgi:hypothetical protein